MDPGSVADWVSGIGTLIAVIVALVTSRNASREARNIRFTSVYGWMQYSDGEWMLVVSNNTEFPVYNWQIQLDWVADGGVRVETKADQENCGILPPGKHDFPIDPELDRPASEASIDVRLEFIDAVGRKHVRSPYKRRNPSFKRLKA